MDSATPLDSYPALIMLPMLAAVEPELLECVDRLYENLQNSILAGGSISFDGQAKLPSLAEGWRHLPLISRRKPGSVAVAASGTMVKRGMTRYAEVLLRSGPMLLFRLVKKSKGRKVGKSGSRNLAAGGGDRFPLFPEKEPVAVAT